MLNQYCKEKVMLIETAMQQLIPQSHPYSQTLFDAMNYSLFAGGKRLRPILLMASAEAVGGNGTAYLPVACSLEMIHTYSLIHDDLPAMDNDDYRRGKLTNHMVFGDGMAILAGDALLTAAFEAALAQPDVEPGRLLKAVQEIAVAAGAQGMVGGQAVDLTSEGKVLDADTLRFMHQAKTGALFRAAIRAGAILAGASAEELQLLTQYAEQFGLAFQITDDILDVVGSQEIIGKPIGSDEKNNKATYVTIYGLENAKIMAQQAVVEALSCLQPFGSKADILHQMANYLITRNS